LASQQKDDRDIQQQSGIFLGTCGWSYAEWEGILYPGRQSKLGQYSSIFPTAEIDSTFYALPKSGTVLGWATYTPKNFVFSAKLPKAITHTLALKAGEETEAHLNQFLEVMKPLAQAQKLACILIQLPPFLKFDIERLESFLSLLPNSQNFAIEFRHNSWLLEQTFRLLEKYRAAYTIVDEPLLPPDIHVTSDLAYIRWHGRGAKPWFNYRYSEDQLQEWVPRVRETAGKAKKVLGYFNNHFHGYAPENCLQIMQMLGIVTPHSGAALRRVTAYRKGGTPTDSGSLEAWIGPVGRTALERLLSKFADPAILSEAESIPDGDFSLREDSKRRLAAYIGNTTVDIDLEQSAIGHGCSVWSRVASEKKFCPHVAKLFLSVKPERAREILSAMSSNLDKWEFQRTQMWAGPSRRAREPSTRT